MIQLKNISKQFEVKGKKITALDNVNLEVPRGTIYGVIGHQGQEKVP